MKKKHPLVSLSWATLPEHAIIGRLANQLIREDHITSLEYNRTRIRDAVRSTYPPYGYLQRRVAAMETEIPRQAEIIAKRRERDAQPEDTIGQPRDKAKRTTDTARAMLGLSYYDVREAVITRYDDRQVIVVLSGCNNIYLKVGPGVFQEFGLERYRSYYNMTERFISAFHGRHGLDKYLDKGCSFRFDFAAMETVVTYPDGSTEGICWLKSTAHHGEHKPAAQKRPDHWPKLPPGKSRTPAPKAQEASEAAEEPEPGQPN